jgi:hypothetical protein
MLAALAEHEGVKAESARRDRRVQLQLAYGAVLMSARGYGAKETVKASDRARELSAGVGGSVDRLALFYGTWLGAVTTESFEAGSKASAELLAEATQARNGGAMGVAHRAVGATLLYGGLFQEAKRQFDKATSLLRSTDDAELARFNGGPRAAAQILRAIASWATSDFDAAPCDVQEATAQAERADDAMTRGYVYGWAATFGAVRRDVLLSGLNARRLLKLVADTGLHTWAPAAEQFERWSRSMSGDGPFSAGELRAAGPALKDVGHDKIVTRIIGGSRRRRRLETAAPTRRSLWSRSSSPKFVRAAFAVRKPSCSASAARRGFSALPPTWIAPTAIWRRPLRSPVNRARVRSNCARRCRWRSSIIRSAALSKPTTSSPPRSKAFHRHRSFPRLRKRKRFSRARLA